MPLYERRALDFFVYMHHLMLLYTIIHHTLAYNLGSAFSDSFNSITSHVNFPSTIPEKKHLFFLYYLALCITPLGLILGLQLCTCNMMQLQLSYGWANFRDAGE